MNGTPTAAEPVGTQISQWGEGPIWHGDKLYYVDIEGHRVLAYSPATSMEEIWQVGERVGTVVPREKGGLVIAGDSGFHFLDPTSGTLTPITDPEADRPDNRFNDGKCDPAGRFWAGTMHLEKPRQATGALYRLDPDLSVRQMFDGVTVSNGIVWNRAADTMCYIDTPTSQVVAFDYDRDSGEITNRRAVVDTTGLAGVPDGMAIDEHDRLWVAMCHGGRIHCFDPGAADPNAPVTTIEVPAIETTAVAFGGPGLDQLYIATGRSGDAQGPNDGSIFVADAGVKGQPSAAFAG